MNNLSVPILTNEWTDEAREASAEARKRHAKVKSSSSLARASSSRSFSERHLSVPNLVGPKLMSYPLSGQTTGEEIAQEAERGGQESDAFTKRWFKNPKPETHMKALRAAKKAASIHTVASSRYREEGDDEMADYHEEMSKRHLKHKDDLKFVGPYNREVLEDQPQESKVVSKPVSSHSSDSSKAQYDGPTKLVTKPGTIGGLVGGVGGLIAGESLAKSKSYQTQVSKVGGYVRKAVQKSTKNPALAVGAGLATGLVGRFAPTVIGAALGKKMGGQVTGKEVEVRDEDAIPTGKSGRILGAVAGSALGTKLAFSKTYLTKVVPRVALQSGVAGTSATFNPLIGLGAGALGATAAMAAPTMVGSYLGYKAGKKWDKSGVANSAVQNFWSAEARAKALEARRQKIQAAGDSSNKANSLAMRARLGRSFGEHREAHIAHKEAAEANREAARKSSIIGSVLLGKFSKRAQFKRKAQMHEREAKNLHPQSTRSHGKLGMVAGAIGGYAKTKSLKGAAVGALAGGVIGRLIKTKKYD